MKAAGAVRAMGLAMTLACGFASAADGTGDALARAQARGETVFRANCAHCHGDRADGDSRVAAVLRPPPANLRVSPMSAADQERMVRLGGLAAFGRSPTMPAWGETLDDGQIKDVITFIRSLSEAPTVAKVR